MFSRTERWFFCWLKVLTDVFSAWTICFGIFFSEIWILFIFCGFLLLFWISRFLKRLYDVER